LERSDQSPASAAGNYINIVDLKGDDGKT